MSLFSVKTMTHSLYINISRKQWVSTLWRMRGGHVVRKHSI